MSTLVSMMIFIFLLGVLTGSGLVTRAQDARGRRQAAIQRQLNDEWRLLREKQEAAEDDMRWLSKQQAGLVVRDYQPVAEPPALGRSSWHGSRRPAQ